jgi:hypothetical protein
MKKNQNAITANSQITRSWQYSRGNVSLNFSLRIDEAKDLQDFLELLRTAAASVEEQLSATKKK